jgi:hypothetical protein
MPIKNTAIVMQYVAWDVSNNVGKTGDAANHSIRAVGDGVEYTPAAAPTQVNTDIPGVYTIAIAAGENNYNTVTLGGKSSTAGVVIIPITWANQLPPGVRRNTLLVGHQFPMYATGTMNRASGKTVTVTRSIDKAAYGAAANSPAEIGTTGMYAIDLAATDLNGGVISFIASAPGCDDTWWEIVTQP